MDREVSLAPASSVRPQASPSSTWARNQLQLNAERFRPPALVVGRTSAHRSAGSRAGRLYHSTAIGPVPSTSSPAGTARMSVQRASTGEHPGAPDVAARPVIVYRRACPSRPWSAHSATSCGLPNGWGRRTGTATTRTQGSRSRRCPAGIRPMTIIEIGDVTMTEAEPTRSSTLTATTARRSHRTPRRRRASTSALRQSITSRPGPPESERR